MQVSTHVEREMGSEYLVTVDPDVLRDVDHALGNLFQKIRNASRLSGQALGPEADRLLKTAVRDIERVVELMLEYVSPADVELRPIPLGRIAESLLAQVRGCRSGEVALASCPEVSVLADSRRLRRCFELLGIIYKRHWAGADQVAISVYHDEAAEQVELRVACSSAADGNESSADSVVWALAGRLIDLHGGTLRPVPTASGKSCAIVLPTVKDGDVGV